MNIGEYQTGVVTFPSTSPYEETITVPNGEVWAFENITRSGISNVDAYIDDGTNLVPVLFGETNVGNVDGYQDVALATVFVDGDNEDMKFEAGGDQTYYWAYYTAKRVS